MTTETTATNVMLGWAIEEFGGPEKMRITQLPMPQPGPGDVLIRMRGAEIGNWDALIREGGWDLDRPFPLVLGLGGSGVVVATGEDVDDVYVGDSVYTYCYPLYENGAWAEYMLVPSMYVAQAPASLDLIHSGAIPIVALTAHETLHDILAVHKGEVVLITAGAGGVGHLAVQMAKMLGAHVIATASTRNVEFVQNLGAEVVIDYTKEDVAALLKSKFPQGVDKALNGVAGDTANQILHTVRPGGRMVDMTDSVTESRADVDLNKNYIVKADAARLTTIATLIDEGGLQVVVQAVCPFEEAPKALELAVAGHVRGKLVLNIETV
ncbi:MAG: NADP-dependent oxidoreductase [Candidatus Obscuribacterales bacterium]